MKIYDFPKFCRSKMTSMKNMEHLLKVLSNLEEKKENIVKYYFSESDDMKTRFEKLMNEREICVAAKNKKVGQSLLFILKCIVDGSELVSSLYPLDEKDPSLNVEKTIDLMQEFVNFSVCDKLDCYETLKIYTLGDIELNLKEVIGNL